MKRVRFRTVLTALLLFASGCSAGDDSALPGADAGPDADAHGPTCTVVDQRQICDPFGIDLGPPAPAGDGYWSVLTQTFRVPYYRPPPILLGADASCASCAAARQRGLDLVFAVRNASVSTAASRAPTDLDAYASQLEHLVAQYSAAIAVVVIEDEIDAPGSFSGSPTQYLAELSAGCKAAHAGGVKCTDSGLSSTTLVFLLADYYVRIGFADSALRVVSDSDTNPDIKAAFATWPPTASELAAVLAAQGEALERAKTLLAGYRAAGVDYVNFHWFEKSELSLDELFAFMRSATGCNAIMTDRLGQRSQDGAETAYKTNDVREYGLPIAVWSSRETSTSVALVDETGKLTPSGAAFQHASITAGCPD